MRSWPSSISSADAFRWLVEHQFVGADLGEIRREHLRRHVLDPRRRPVSDCGPCRSPRRGRPRGNRRCGRPPAPRDIRAPGILPGRRAARQPQQLQRHHHAARRFFVQRLQGRQRELRAVALRAPRRCPPCGRSRTSASIIGSFAATGPAALAGRKAVDQLADIGRGHARANLGQRLAQLRPFGRRHHGVGKCAWIASGPFMVWPVRPK